MTESTALPRRHVRHELVQRHLTVSAVRPVAGRIVRVTLTGDLDGFAADGPTDHLKVFFPDPATGVVATPGFARGGVGLSAPGRVTGRDYTPLDFRPDAGELDLDFVVHGDDGPASTWAHHAAPGDRLVVAGPKSSKLVPDGLTALVLVVDETAFPAASRWLRLTPHDVPVTVLLDAADAAARYFDGAAGAARATFRTGGDREAALRSLPIEPGTFVFLAGEATALVPLRRYLRRELGLGPEQVAASGYWKRGVAGLDHHAPVDPDDPD
ncbi:MAG TPA: siderophore-interacting protein [Cellulomonas sp.]